MKIYFGGDTSYKSLIIKMLSAAYSLVEVNSIEDADLIYWIYGKGPDLRKNYKLWLRKRQFLIVHWIGTDVLNHTEKLSSKKIKSRIFHSFWNYLIITKTHKKQMVNFACAEWLVQELATVGIESFYLPITTIVKKNMPIDIFKKRNIDFISYLPLNRFNFYNGDLILNLVKYFKEYSFLLIIPDIKNINEFPFKDLPNNVTIKAKISFEEMMKIFKKSKCFLRFTKHDGLSLSVLEALASGMQVIWTHSFPYTINVSLEKYEYLKILMKEKIDSWELNLKGREYVLSTFSENSIEKRFKQLLEKIKL